MTTRLSRLILATALVSVTAFGSMGGAHDVQAKTIDLGFMLDESGSVGSSNYNIAGDALAAALALIPFAGTTTDTYRIGVVSFSGGTTTLVSPTIISSAAELLIVQNSIKNDAFSGGSTNMGGALDRIVADFGTLGDLSLLNMTTDGVPNSGTQAATAATAAFNAGWDGLSFEAIGNISTALIQSIAFPAPAILINDINNLPNPLTTGFVLTIDNFGNYSDAITAKIQNIVDVAPNVSVVPLPAALPLYGTGLAIMGFISWRRKRKGAATA